MDKKRQAKVLQAVSKMQGVYCIGCSVKIIGYPYNCSGQREYLSYENKQGKIIEIYKPYQSKRLLPSSTYYKIDFGRKQVRWFPNTSVTWK